MFVLPYPARNSRTWLLLTLTVLGVLSYTKLYAEEVSHGAPDSLKAYYSGNGLLNRGLYNLAEQEYQSFLSAHTNHEKAYVARYGLAVAMFRQGKFSKAAIELATLHELNQKGFAAEIATMLGQCHLILHQYNKAAAAFLTVIQSHTTHDLADDAAAGAIEAFYSLGSYKDTIKTARLINQRWPKSPLIIRSTFFAALSEMQMSDYTQAASHFERVIEGEPTSDFAEQSELMLAQCYHHTNKLNKAMKWYQRVLDRGASELSADALVGLGTLQQAKGDTQAAAKTLDQLLKGHPGSTRTTEVKFRRAQIWYSENNFDKAESLFTQVSQSKTDFHDDALFWLAKCNLQQSKPTNAADILTKAIESCPNSELMAEMNYDLAVAQFRSEQYDQAAKVLQRFLKTYTSHTLLPDAIYLLASCQHQLGQYDTSKSLAQELIKSFRNHPLASEALLLQAENDFLSQRFDLAEKNYRKAIDHKLSETSASRALFRMGMAQYEQKKFNASQKTLATVTSSRRAEQMYPAAWLALGDIAFRRGDWPIAVDRLTTFLAVNAKASGAAEAMLKLGLSLQRLNKFDEAIVRYSKLIERFPQSPHQLQAQFELGQALVSLGNTKDATNAFEAVLAQSPKSRFAPFALQHLGAIAMRGKHFDKAAALFARAEKLSFGDDREADVVFRRGTALMASKRYEEAESVLKRFIKTDPSQSHATEALANIVIAQARQNKCEDAVESAKRVSIATDSTWSSSLHSTILYEKAWCLNQLGRTNEAMASYRTLIEKHPHSTVRLHAMLDLGVLYTGDKQYAMAIPVLTKLRDALGQSSAQISDEVHEQALHDLAYCQFQTGNYKFAAALFQEFVSRFPDSASIPSASFFGGESLFHIGQQRQALEHFQRVVDFHKQDQTYKPSLLRLGECLGSLQRWPQSEQTFTTFLERFSDDPQWYQAAFGVGWAQEHQQRFDEAISSYKKIVANHEGPTAARAQFQIGECLFAQKKYTLAARALLRVDILYAYPKWSAASLYEAGRCFEMLAKPVEARQQFQAVAQGHQDTRWAQLANNKLKTIGNDMRPSR